MVEPPLEVGASQDRATWPEEPVPMRLRGALGVVAGVALEFVIEAVPSPAKLTAATWKSYAVPFVSPVTVALVVVLVPSAKVVHSPLGLVRYCTI